jgi:outer membrane protein insertion porin family
MALGTVELTQPLGKILKAAVFYDTGNVWVSAGDFMSTKLYSGIGAGLRIKTPLGPVSIDYGFPLDTEPGRTDKSGRVHFNMSHGF